MLVAIVFAQLGVAAYACPGDAVAVASASSEPIDAGHPGLCHKHCNGEQQPGPQVPGPAAFCASFVATVQHVERVSTRPLVPPELAHATAPPVALSHCRWQI